MSDNARHGLWMVAGGYLAFNGIDLIRNVMNEKPDNYILFSVAGVLFILFGLFMVVQAIKGLRKKEDIDGQSEQENTELPEEETETLAEETGLEKIEKKEETNGE